VFFHDVEFLWLIFGVQFTIDLRIILEFDKQKQINVDNWFRRDVIKAMYGCEISAQKRPPQTGSLFNYGKQQGVICASVAFSFVPEASVVVPFACFPNELQNPISSSASSCYRSVWQAIAPR